MTDEKPYKKINPGRLSKSIGFGFASTGRGPDLRKMTERYALTMRSKRVKPSMPRMPWDEEKSRE